MWTPSFATPIICHCYKGFNKLNIDRYKNNLHMNISNTKAKQSKKEKEKRGSLYVAVVLGRHLFFIFYLSLLLLACVPLMLLCCRLLLIFVVILYTFQPHKRPTCWKTCSTGVLLVYPRLWKSFSSHSCNRYSLFVPRKCEKTQKNHPLTMLLFSRKSEKGRLRPELCLFDASFTTFTI